MRRVVVTGIGMVNALGLNKDISFQRIVKGECGIKHIESFDTTDFPVKIAGEITDFDPESVLDPKEVKKAHRFIHLGLLASRDALHDSVKNSKQSFLDHNSLILSDIANDFGISHCKLYKGTKARKPFLRSLRSCEYARWFRINTTWH